MRKHGCEGERRLLDVIVREDVVEWASLYGRNRLAYKQGKAHARNLHSESKRSIHIARPLPTQGARASAATERHKQTSIIHGEPMARAS